jgi:hypothetical protein
MAKLVKCSGKATFAASPGTFERLKMRTPATAQYDSQGHGHADRLSLGVVLCVGVSKSWAPEVHSSGAHGYPKRYHSR